MAFGKTCHADAEAASVRGVCSGTNKADQTLGVGKGILEPVVVRHVARWIAAQGHDVLDSGGSVAIENGRQLFPRVTDTGEMRSGRQFGFPVNAHYQVMC